MASGDTLIVFVRNNAKSGTADASETSERNEHPLIAFDDTTAETAIFPAILPRNYSTKGININVHYAMATATSGDVKWDGYFERVGDSEQDIDSDGFAAAQTVTETVPATSGYVSITSIVFDDGADIDSVVNGEHFRFKLERDTGVAGNASGDAQVLTIEFTER